MSSRRPAGFAVAVLAVATLVPASPGVLAARPAALGEAQDADVLVDGEDDEQEGEDEEAEPADDDAAEPAIAPAKRLSPDAAPEPAEDEGDEEDEEEEGEGEEASEQEGKAARAGQADGEEAGAAEEEGLGLEVAAGISSIYAFRGVNVFADTHPRDQNAMASLGLSYSLGPLSISYWSAYQLRGKDVSGYVADGTGAEQDISLSYEQELAGPTVSLSLAAYLYPFADPAAPGSELPAYLEPALGLGWSGFADLGLNVSWFAGLEGELAEDRYVYLNPTLVKTFELSKAAGLELSAGYGYKLRTAKSNKDNVFDVLLSVGLPLQLLEGVTVTPSANGAWTNCGATEVADEYMIWGALTATWAG